MTTVAVSNLDGFATPTAHGQSVSTIVGTCHTLSIDAGLAALGEPRLDRDGLEALLTYCAEQRCVGDAVTCPGCSRRTQQQGFRSLDDFIAGHRRIETPAGMVLQGSGSTDLTVASLDALAASWTGRDVWFEARRVLRKLRHGVRSRDPGAATRDHAARPTVVLVEPQLPDNIGMVARAMANFGLEELRLVKPRDGWPNERARIAASGATFIVEEARMFDSFEAALGDLTWVCATTARQRDLAKPVLTPAQAVAEMRVRIMRGERVGMVFGRERNGLETSEIANADAIVMIPVDSRHASLNIAQAVLLLAYEWLKDAPEATLGRVTTYETARDAGLHGRGFLPADKAQLTGLFEHLEGELDHSGFFNPPEKRPTIVQNLRSMLTRLGASEQEVRTLRGVIKALVHGKGRGRKP